jgi:cytidylate kinase
MNPNPTSVARLTDAMAHAQKHWRERGKEKPAHGTAAGPTVALTREAGVPGTTIANAIGQRLGWPVYDHELLERISQETGWRISLLESIDQKRRGWLLESMEQFAAVPSVSESAYVRHVIETILSLGAHGECIIVERGAAQILPYESTLRVRVVAERDDRLAAIARRWSLTAKEAARKQEEIDRRRAAFIHENFQKELAAPGQYDLLLNSSRWSVEQCVDLIIEALRQLPRASAAASAPAIQSAPH